MLNLKKIGKKIDKLISKITKEDFDKWVKFDNERTK